MRDVRSGVAAALVAGLVLTWSTAGVAAPDPVLWRSHYNGPASKNDNARAEAVSPDGSKLFVTGWSQAANGLSDYLTIAYDSSTGAAVWTSRYDGPAHLIDHPTAIAVSPDGSKVFVTGESAGSTHKLDYETVAYSATNGAQLWAKRYDGPANADDHPTEVGVSPDGAKVIVTGGSYGRTRSELDAATIAYGTATGATQWIARSGGPGRIEADLSMAISPNGTKVFVTGFDGTSKGDEIDTSRYKTVAYSINDGSPVWIRSAGPMGGLSISLTVRVSPDATKVFVTGSSAGDKFGSQTLTIAYRAGAGSTLWSRSDAGMSVYAPGSFAVAGDGKAVFVVGQGSIGSQWGTKVMAYDSTTGRTKWSRLLTGGNDGTPEGMTVSPDGRRLFAAVGISNEVPYYQRVVALDTGNGKTTWNHKYDDIWPVANDNGTVQTLAASPDSSRLFITGAHAAGNTHHLDFVTIAMKVH
ncbi:MAG: hypothetical protein JWM47_3079 [Acidimicrobiales bacterium]|nr:hypothetical protein [Acidimicrobiales bacterium]